MGGAGAVAGLLRVVVPATAFVPGCNLLFSTPPRDAGSTADSAHTASWSFYGNVGTFGRPVRSRGLPRVVGFVAAFDAWGRSSSLLAPLVSSLCSPRFHYTATWVFAHPHNSLPLVQQLQQLCGGSGLAAVLTPLS